MSNNRRIIAETYDKLEAARKRGFGCNAMGWVNDPTPEIDIEAVNSLDELYDLYGGREALEGFIDL